MRLIPKRLSGYSQTEPRTRKPRKPTKKEYYEVDSDTESSQDSDEVITPRTSNSAPSPTATDFFVDSKDGQSGNFVRAMRIIKKESWRKSTIIPSGTIVNPFELTVETVYPPSTAGDDVVFAQACSEHKAKERAIYIASRIKQQLPAIFEGCQLIVTSTHAGNLQSDVSTVDMAKMIADRLYTYWQLTDTEQGSYATERMELLQKLEVDLTRTSDAELGQKPSGREAFYAFRYTLDNLFRHSILPSQKTLMVERARLVIQNCIESEEILSTSERACMYSFHRLMSDIDWDNDEMKPVLCGLYDS